MKILIIIVVLFQASFAFNQTETSVLFIGNSLTFSYNMPFKFKEIAESFGRKVYVDTAVKRGMGLNYHSSQTNTYAKINSRKWDFIILQGQSTEFSKPTEAINVNSRPFAKKLIDSIRKNSGCTKILFYETWGYKNGIDSLPLISDYNSMQSVIEKEYLRFADVFSVGVVPVGGVWRRVREKHPTINLYNEDLYHPSIEGSYLAACTFYSSIFRVSSVNNTAISSLSKELRYSIETSASQAVLGHFDKWRLSPKSPEMKLGYDVILQNNQLELYNRAENYNSIIWSFGDATTSVKNNPKHIYKKKGTYLINQKIMNKCGVKNLRRKIIVKNIP